jgi:hypothetical protein
MADQASVEAFAARRKAAAEKARTTKAAAPQNMPTIDVEPSEISNPTQTKAPLVSSQDSPATGRSVALPQVDYTRQIDQSDLIMPRLMLSQAMSKVNTDDIVRQGNWYHTGANENLGKEVLIVPMDQRKSRSKMDKDTGQVVCRSMDMVHGVGDPGILCEGTEEERYSLPADERGCEFRHWKRVDGKNIPPECPIAYNFPVLIVSDRDPEVATFRRAILTLRGTGSPAGQAIISAAYDQELPYHQLMFKLGVAAKTNARGQTFFTPSVELLGRAPKDFQDRAERFIQNSGSAVAMTIEAE